mgnify:CR=1 FL=1
MIKDVLTAFKEKIEKNVRQADNKKVNVAFVKLDQKPISSNTINLLLFTGNEKRNLPVYHDRIAPLPEEKAIVQKPNLRLSLDVLMIFNFSQYTNAIDCYDQVLGLFYVDDQLLVNFDGQQVSVEVVISSFNDRNEIEIRNSFQIPGAPLLRYDLNYALIQGSAKKFPAIQKWDVNGTPSDDKLPLEVIENLLQPIQNGLSDINSREGNFLGLTPETVQHRQHQVTVRYKELRVSYESAREQLRQILMKDKFTWYHAAVNVFSDRLLQNQNLLEATTGGFEILKATVEHTKDERMSFSSAFENHLMTTVAFKSIQQLLIEKVVAFNGVCKSLYDFDEQSMEIKGEKKLSFEQEKIWWWQMAHTLLQLVKTYDEVMEQKLFHHQQVPSTGLIVFLKSLRDQLTGPIEQIKTLNLRYFDEDQTATEESSNSTGPIGKPRPGDDGKLAFLIAYKAANEDHQSDLPVGQSLETQLQKFLSKIISYN